MLVYLLTWYFANEKPISSASTLVKIFIWSLSNENPGIWKDEKLIEFGDEEKINVMIFQLVMVFNRGSYFEHFKNETPHSAEMGK